MAKKPAPKKAAAPKIPDARPVTLPAESVASDKPIAETAVRKTVAPKAAPAPTAKKAPAPVTYERIAERAYYISQSGGGSEYDNWLRAEAELKNDNV